MIENKNKNKNYYNKIFCSIILFLCIFMTIYFELLHNINNKIIDYYDFLNWFIMILIILYDIHYLINNKIN